MKAGKIFFVFLFRVFLFLYLFVDVPLILWQIAKNVKALDGEGVDSI